MDIHLLALLSAILGYMFGSIPNALIIGKVFYHVDVRKLGSGNLGATNVARNLGFFPGMIVGLLDFSKAIISTHLMYLFAKLLSMSTEQCVYLYLLTGLFTCIGHCFPLFAHFKGGKCVSVISGFVLGSNWIIFIIGLLIFIGMMVYKKIVSLASIVMVISASILSFISPLIKYGFYNMEYTIYYSLLITIMSIIVIIRHRQNIQRLFLKTEKKFEFIKK